MFNVSDQVITSTQEAGAFGSHGKAVLHLGWLLGLDHCKQLPGRAYHQKAGAANIKDRGERKVDGEGH